MEKSSPSSSHLLLAPFISLLLLMPSARSLLPPSPARRLSSSTPTASADAEALLRFKKSIAQDPKGILFNWDLKNHLCNWRGVNCSQSDGRVIQLDLHQCDLAGALDFRPLSSLDALSVINLSSNSFSVNSTEALLQLPVGLTKLDLSNAGLAGNVPDGFIARYQNIVYINLSKNNLTGLLPADILSYSGGEKLQVLDLSFNNLTGAITGWSMEDNYKSLVYVDLSKNHLVDAVPGSLSNCAMLRNLNLSSNELTGEIPQALGNLSSLQMLDLSNNHISGPIPQELGNACGSLLQMKLSGNNISGSIPTTLASCSSLQVLDLARNNISGPFPRSILPNLSSLEELLLSENYISGTIPASLSACKNLRVVDFGSNELEGEIPTAICPGAASLEELRAPNNLIEGEIPVQLSLCSHLKTIDFSINYLTGKIPPEIGQLKNLEQLMVWYNGLQGGIPPELGGCGRLKDLILNNNGLTGEIPPQLFNCSNLEWISLTSNGITGNIAPEFGRLPRLAILQLGNNSMNGSIPTELGNCSSLIWLDLSSNHLSGEIPPRLGRQLGNATLEGILSGNTIGFLRSAASAGGGVGGLLELNGIRQERLHDIPAFQKLNSQILYSGPAVTDFSRLSQTLEYLDLSNNDLRGKIPDEFGGMLSLQVLAISHNKISGEIPWSLGQLRALGVLNAAHNRLQGTIPESLTNLSFLVVIDLSYNELTGAIPSRGQLSTLPASQYAHNPGLCGVPLPPCSHGNPTPPVPPAQASASDSWRWVHSVVLAVAATMAFLCLLIVWLIASRARKKEAARMLERLQGANAPTTWNLEREREPLSINVATFQRQLRKLTFSQLVEATNGFSASSLIGYGGFGEVFRATLKDGSCVAVKKLIRLSYQGDREFMAEMETLGKIKHRHLVPLLGYCKVGEERLLVYEFMMYGSLEDMLHCKRKEGRILTWAERRKIARGAAKGLCFLHHNCIPHIIHRDMKSSNVLLDGDMEARVSDFGMARLISALDTHLSVSTLAGTPGYVPPEYYQSFRCTAKGDVYSFGVVLLELLAGKRPTDKDDFGDTNLVGWAKMKVREGKGREVIDTELLSVPAPEEGSGGEQHRGLRDDIGSGGEQHHGLRDDIGSDGGKSDGDAMEIMRYLEIALQCVEDFPSRRPNMLQVVAMLRELIPVADGDEAGD